MEKELENYPLIPMKEIDPVAREIAVRWHENATDWIGDKHKLASDIMNYGKNRVKDSAAPDLLEALEGLIHEDGGSLAFSAGHPKCVAARTALAKALTPIK